MAEPKQPLNVYVVNERTDAASGKVHKNWREVGVAWPNSDGKGFSLQIDPGISISGNNIVVRERKASDTTDPD